MWQQLQRPIRLTDGVYLAIYPYSAQLGGVGAEGKNVVAHLRLMAAPRILSGPTPSGAQFERPIPPLQRSDQVGTGANVQVSAAIAYPVASTMLRRAVNGRAFEQAGRTVRIRDVRLSGVGGGRVALDVRLAGAVRGHLYLTGTPSFDATNHQVYVPDLDYDVGTAQLLVAGFGWLKGVDIRDFLRARARLPGSAVMDKLRALAESGVNRTLAPGVVLSGRIDHVEGTSVRATTRELQLRAAAFAELKLAIDKPPPLPRLPRQPKP